MPAIPDLATFEALREAVRRLWLDAGDAESIADDAIAAVPVLHKVGGAGEPAYTALFTDHSAQWGGARFWKAQGTVFLEGLIGGGPATAAANSLLFTLPVGFRPQIDLAFRVAMYYGSWGAESEDRITVEADGDVRIQTGWGTGGWNWISMSGVAFYAG